MLRRTLAVAALVLFGTPVTILAQPASAPAITIAVACKSVPEVTRVTNTTKQAITITSIGTTYQPRKAEPFRINRVLAAGQTLTFHSGRGATTNVLTKQFIYEDKASAGDGARVVTSAGTFTTYCR